MDEQWREIEGFDGKYEVSDLGNVRRVGYELITPSRGVRVYKTRTLRQRSDGTVNLVKRGGTSTTRSVRMAVAGAFLGPAPPYSRLMHRDGNIANCAVDNLVWMLGGGVASIPRWFGAEQGSRVRRLYIEGMSVEEIAEKIPVDRRVVLSALAIVEVVKCPTCGGAGTVRQEKRAQKTENMEK